MYLARWLEMEEQNISQEFRDLLSRAPLPVSREPGPLQLIFVCLQHRGSAALETG